MRTKCVPPEPGQDTSQVCFPWKGCVSQFGGVSSVGEGQGSGFWKMLGFLLRTLPTKKPGPPKDNGESGVTDKRDETRRSTGYSRTFSLGNKCAVSLK